MVVVVVPALTTGQQGDEDVVPARVHGVVPAATEDVRQRVHRERRMPQQHVRQEEPDDQAAPPADQEARHAQRPHRDPVVLVQEPQLGVAGEVLDRVRVRGRVLVAEDPSDVAPPEALPRRVEIALGVGELVMTPVVAGPPEHALLTRRPAAEGHDELRGPPKLVAAMREVPVVPGGDEEHPAEERDRQQGKGRGRHARHEGEQRQQLEQEERDRRADVHPLARGSGDGVFHGTSRDSPCGSSAQSSAGGPTDW